MQNAALPFTERKTQVHFDDFDFSMHNQSSHSNGLIMMIVKF